MSSILSIRTSIDNVNEQLISLLLERKNLSIEIGEIKRNMGIPIYNPCRENNIYKSIKTRFPSDYEYLLPIFEAILLSSRNVQK
jgi:chorismate mutase